MKSQGVRLFVWLLLSGCFGSGGCASVNPPINSRVFHAGDHRCVCDGIPEGFDMSEAMLVGGAAWVQITEYQNKCIEAGMIEANK